jgi:hypothetical protein
VTGESTFIVGVFQDVAWAERGVAALLAEGFTPEAITILARDTEPAAALIRAKLGADPERLELKSLGAVAARGPLIAVLRGADNALSIAGLAATVGRAGFQAHDGYIFETLAGRGGVLVAIRSGARAADALAKLHAYGGGNAAIGAYAGRV